MVPICVEHKYVRTLIHVDRAIRVTGHLSHECNSPECTGQRNSLLGVQNTVEGPTVRKPKQNHGT
jgi:hypothetical protein